MVSPDPNREIWLGERRDGSAGPVSLPLGVLLRHAAALGSSGSGKTVLCKAIVEEAVRSGLPAICIDPQGDLCSLASAADADELRQRGVDPMFAEELRRRADVVVFTPASRKGVPLCADPVERGVSRLDPADRLQVIGRSAAMISALLGYDPETDDGAGLIAVLDSVLNERVAAGRPLERLADLAAHLEALDKSGFGTLGRLLDPKKIRSACQRLARLEVGARRLMFHDGVPIDIDLLLGLEGAPGALPGRTRVSIIYLNSLGSQEDKEFFVAALVNRLYAWMLEHPSPTPQALFYIDEVAPFLPPVRKPASKDGLMLLLKQARKYGVCCLLATQNPGDVDYKAMAQLGTWALGRMTTRQDLKKVEPTLNALAPVECEGISQTLPRLEAGEFVLLSPDAFDAPCALRSRWLLSKHETWDEQRIAKHGEGTRPRFKGAEVAQPAGASADAAPRGDAVSALAPLPAAEPSRGAEPPADRPERPARAAPASRPRAVALEDHARTLAAAPAMSASDYAAAAGVGETKARTLLKALVEAGLARSFKQGQRQLFFSLASGARPDLGLPARVGVLAARVDPEAAQRIGQSLVRTSLLGLGGAAEVLDRVELVHRLVYRIDFEEQVARDLLARLIGRGPDVHLGSVYLHPRTLSLLVLGPDGFSFSERPAEHASLIPDLDGMTHVLEAAPAALAISEEDLDSGRAPAEAERAFCARFAARPSRTTPLFLPLYRVLLTRGGGAQRRVVTIDGITGRPIVWPE